MQSCGQRIFTGRHDSNIRILCFTCYMPYMIFSLHLSEFACRNVYFQLVSHCVDVLVTAFKDTIIAECPSMIKNNETESKLKCSCQVNVLQLMYAYIT
jgi:hypothetical protein